MNQEYCDCCLRGGQRLNKIKLCNTNKYVCNCVKFVCADCRKNKKVLTEYLEFCAEKCSKEIKCEVISG